MLGGNRCKKTMLHAAAISAAFIVSAYSGSALAASPFDTLLGSWSGTGKYELNDGTSKSLNCHGYYTGGGYQLGMAIRCTAGGTQAIEIRSRLKDSSGRVSGVWEERTYNAQGTARGSVNSRSILLRISGQISGTMRVNFSRTRQSVTVSTQGSALKGVIVNLRR